MERSKTRPVSNTVVFSLCFAVCFAALIHVEIEIHAHRQMLQVLNQQREGNIQLLNSMREKTIDSVLHSDLDKGEQLFRGRIRCGLVRVCCES